MRTGMRTVYCREKSMLGEVMNCNDMGFHWCFMGYVGSGLCLLYSYGAGRITGV